VSLYRRRSKEIELYQHGNNLTVEGEHKESKEKKDADYLDQEFSYQSFQRTIVLPEGVDAQKLSADFTTECWRLPRQ